MFEVLQRIVFGDPELSLSLGPLAIGLITSLAAPVAGRLLGGGGGTAGPQGAGNAALTQQSQVETDLLEQQRDIISRLMEMANNYEGEPIGRLDLPDSRFLDEDFLGSLEPSRDIELLQSLLGRSVGSGATGALAKLNQRQSELDYADRAERGESIASIIDSIFSNLKDRKGGDEGPPDDGPTATDVFDQYVGRTYF